jgi:hypothetical protein
MKTLRDGRSNVPVYDTVEWDGTNHRGDPVASGLYILHLATGRGVKQARVLLVR